MKRGRHDCGKRGEKRAEGGRRRFKVVDNVQGQISQAQPSFVIPHYKYQIIEYGSSLAQKFLHIFQQFAPPSTLHTFDHCFYWVYFQPGLIVNLSGGYGRCCALFV